jgi:hypothetical protein
VRWYVQVKDHNSVKFNGKEGMKRNSGGDGGRIVRNKQFVFGLRITFLVTKAPLGRMEAADDGAHRAVYGAGFWEFLRS